MNVQHHLKSSTQNANIEYQSQSKSFNIADGKNVLHSNFELNRVNMEADSVTPLSITFIVRVHVCHPTFKKFDFVIVQNMPNFWIGSVHDTEMHCAISCKWTWNASH